MIWNCSLGVETITLLINTCDWPYELFLTHLTQKIMGTTLYCYHFASVVLHSWCLWCFFTKVPHLISFSCGKINSLFRLAWTMLSTKSIWFVSWYKLCMWRSPLKFLNLFGSDKNMAAMDNRSLKFAKKILWNYNSKWF